MATIDLLLRDISPRRLAQQVGILHEDTRVGFPLENGVVADFDGYRNLLCDYYIYHFTQCIARGGSMSRAEAWRRVREILEREYRRRNGNIVTAFNDARDGTNLPLGAQINLIANALKNESIESHIRDAFDRYVAPNSYEQRVEIIRQFIAGCGALLSTSIDSERPERYAHDYEPLIRSYVDALEHTAQQFRRL